MYAPKSLPFYCQAVTEFDFDGDNLFAGGDDLPEELDSFSATFTPSTSTAPANQAPLVSVLSAGE